MSPQDHAKRDFPVMGVKRISLGCIWKTLSDTAWPHARSERPILELSVYVSRFEEHQAGNLARPPPEEKEGGHRLALFAVSARIGELSR
jgi:hypothetical protein